MNKVQSQRSSTPGARPTGRPPGELYTNWPDNQLGVINASNVAVDLLAVRFFSTLATYVIGDYVKQGVLVYRAIANNGPGAFNVANWSQLQTAADTTFVPLAGGTMTGPLVLNADASAALGAATKQQVDLKAPLASPVFTGNPTAPTPTAGDNDTSIATTAFVTTATGNSGVVVSDTPPATPPQGKMWFDSAGSQLYVRYDDGTSAQWVIAVNNPPDLSNYATVSYVDARAVKGGYRNLLRRNGGMEIWQRGAGGTAGIVAPASAATYGPDGWYLFTNASQASDMSQNAGIVNGSQYAASVRRSAGQTGVGIMTFGFPLDSDELYPALGQYVCLSLTLKSYANWSPAGGNINVRVQAGTAGPIKATSGFTALTDLILVTQAITATATRYQFISTVPVPVGTRQMEVFLQWTPVGTAGAFDAFQIDDVQLEIVPAATGYVASDFERLNFQEQLLLCQRHYQKTFLYATAPAYNNGVDTGEMQGIAGKAAATAGNYLFLRPPVPMRSSPSMVGYNPAAVDAQVRDLAAGVSCTSPVFVAYAHSIRCNFTGAAGTAVGNLCGLHFTADAGI